MEMAERGRVTSVAIEIPVSEGATSCSPPRMPPRLRRRLSESKISSPSSIEEIEAKLRDADLRRQKFYETLSSKARSKPRSLSQSSFNEVDLGQRLEAKLQAAEQKRLSILAKAQMRLAKLDELRQAAKMGVEMRYRKECAELNTKVESKVQQAEANRLLLLKAKRQRRAMMKERTFQSLQRRTARESKYKERVCAAISHKRAAAEKKRLGLLEAEKRKARAMVLQARKIAKCVTHQREIERKEMQNKLEDRLQRAKRQRAEYLMQRVKVNNNSPKKVLDEEGENLSNKLARIWRKFREVKKTTFNLAKSYHGLNINESSVKSMPFEQLAVLIESPASLLTTKALLDRIESRYKLLQVAESDIEHLLKRVVTPKKKRKVAKSKSPSKSPVQLSRYQVRIVLCAYMILGHPDAVFSGQGDREITLAKTAKSFVKEFELLVKVILDGPVKKENGSHTFRSQVGAFDTAWCAFLSSFVSWKVKDAQSLEDDLVRAACQLEISMIQTCKLTSEGSTTTLTHDMEAVQKQVNEDQNLLREKVHHLSGEAGIERMENALSDTRTKYFQARENRSALTYTSVESDQKSNRVKRSLFKEEVNLENVVTSRVTLENESIVNEIIHGQFPFSDNLKVGDDLESSIKNKVKTTMENAFWDVVMESVKQDEPNYNQVVELMKEVRDELSGLAPQSWKQEIIESVDLDILSQVLTSGKLDMDYLGNILDFALNTVRKLSAPAVEDELKSTHMKFLEELSDIGSKDSNVIALIKGLRFVSQQIQGLKEEISKARIKMFEPFLRGPAAAEYLRKAFTQRYGPHTDALKALPCTKIWLSSVKDGSDREWDEHITAFTELTRRSHLPLTTLKTGGSFTVKTSKDQFNSTTEKTSQLLECKGEKVDLFVRLGLLKLVTGLTGLTQEELPETLKLNLFRLRDVQARIQKIIVMATSILVLRQTLLSERMLTNASDMEIIVSSGVKKLSELLDTVENAGIREIIETVSKVVEDVKIDGVKLESMKEVMGRMLFKALQADDTIFIRVSRAIYLAARGVVLGGTGGKEIAEIALRQVGAGLLVDEVIEAASVLVVVGMVSVDVHAPWYSTLLADM